MRVFFELLYHARIFSFPKDTPVMFHSVFTNPLNERLLYEGFSRSCLYRLKGQVELRPERAEDLAQAILPAELTDRRAVIERAMAALPGSVVLGATQPGA